MGSPSLNVPQDLTGAGAGVGAGVGAGGVKPAAAAARASDEREGEAGWDATADGGGVRTATGWDFNPMGMPRASKSSRPVLPSEPHASCVNTRYANTRPPSPSVGHRVAPTHHRLTINPPSTHHQPTTRSPSIQAFLEQSSPPSGHSTAPDRPVSVSRPHASVR